MFCVSKCSYYSVTCFAFEMTLLFSWHHQALSFFDYSPSTTVDLYSRNFSRSSHFLNGFLKLDLNDLFSNILFHSDVKWVLKKKNLYLYIYIYDVNSDIIKKKVFVIVLLISFYNNFNENHILLKQFDIFLNFSHFIHKKIIKIILSSFKR